MLTPADRARCAAALKDATPETLRAWASAAIRRAEDDREDIARMGGKPSPFGILDGLAALALAVATMQTKRAEVMFGARGWVEITYDQYGDVQGATFPAALAALVAADA